MMLINVYKKSNMKPTLILALALFFFTSCRSQTSVILEKTKIDWQQYPNLFADIDKTIYKAHFQFLSKLDFYEIMYESDGLQIQSFAAIPKKEGVYPVIVFNRGGNRDFGALQLFKNAGEAKVPVVPFFSPLALEGYIVIGCNYRGSGKSGGADEFGGADVNDVLNLLEVIKEIPQADTSKIGMYGWSRGGMMTYLSLVRSKQIKAAVVGGAPTDKTIIDRPGMETGVYAELIPDYWENKTTALKKRSAVFWADQFSKDVPLLILHGNNDWRVKSTQSLQLALELEKYRIPYRLKIFEGGDHGLRDFRSEVNQDVLNWFDRFLKNEEPVPDMNLPNKGN